MAPMHPAVQDYQLWRKICYKDSAHCARLAVSIQDGIVGPDWSWSYRYMADEVGEVSQLPYTLHSPVC